MGVKKDSLMMETINFADNAATNVGLAFRLMKIVPPAGGTE